MMKKQLVQMRGTKKGFVLQLDDQCSFAELLDELEKKVLEGTIEGKIDVLLHVGRRYCTNEHKQQLASILEHNGNLRVVAIKSDVLTVEECQEMLRAERSDTYVGIVRSGQIVRAPGDIVVIGDVNPNGRVEAGGNIHIMGKLKGIAHAGVRGNREAIITASYFEPTHVLIANQVELMTNEHAFILEHTEQLCAYIDGCGNICYEKIQEARKIRPYLSTYEGEAT